MCKVEFCPTKSAFQINCPVLHVIHIHQQKSPPMRAAFARKRGNPTKGIHGRGQIKVTLHKPIVQQFHAGATPIFGFVGLSMSAVTSNSRQPQTFRLPRGPPLRQPWITILRVPPSSHWAALGSALILASRADKLLPLVV